MIEKKKSICFGENFEITPVFGEEELADVLASKAEPVLRLEAIQGAGGNDGKVLQAAAFAQMELDRREFEQTKKLTTRTTWASALVGIGGTLLGALLGSIIGG